MLPAVATTGKKIDANLVAASNDFEALERLRRLAFSDSVPEPKQKTLFVEEEPADEDDG